MNSGDWVESLTALVEHFDGRWEILYYNELTKEEIPPQPIEKEISEFKIPSMFKIKIA